MASSDSSTPRTLASGLLVFGAGGHGRVVADALDPARVWLVDDDCDRVGTVVVGLRVHSLDQLPDDVRQFVVAIGDATVREATAARLVRLGFEPTVVHHPTAVISTHGAIDPGTVVLARASIGPGAAVGAHCVVNTGAIVEHDVRLRDFAFVGPGAILAGGVSVGAHAFIGAGAVVLPGVTIGERAIVGAGAVVHRDVEPRATVVGNPATKKGERVR